MILNDFKFMFLRDLGRLKDELHGYSNESDMWQLVPGTTNSAGNLALHLIGNLRHFIGNELGKSGYVRKRDDEFNLKNILLSDLDSLIKVCSDEVAAAFDNNDQSVLSQEFPKEVSGQIRHTSFALLHLLGHFSYHLGQINYHRRFITSSK